MYSLEHRPFSFDDMIGQKGTLSEMKKRSKTKEFPEVMIFAGESGTGKSTLAFIVAALINDNNPIKSRNGELNPNPDSPASKSILNESFNRDVHFYDASTMGKDDVLKLESIVSSTPMFDKNKVIIIDEAQELSKAGKGVTLKLLEKKRRNSYIILCTMNINAFDKAVKSRGQLYTFRTPSSSEIAEYLFDLTEKSKKEVSEEFFETGIFTIAENCEGSVRYAVQNLERCLVGEFYTEEQITQELGLLSENKLTNMIMKILKKDISVFKEIKDFSSQEFFFKATKTLMDAFIYNKTGYIDSDWKKGFADKISKLEGLERLVPIFVNISKETYFKESLFFYELSKFMSIQNKRQRV